MVAFELRTDLSPELWPFNRLMARHVRGTHRRPNLVRVEERQWVSPREMAQKRRTR